MVIGSVTDSSSIRFSGRFLTLDPDSLRGDGPLLRDLRGYDRVHLCRTNNCAWRRASILGPTRWPDRTARRSSNWTRRRRAPSDWAGASSAGPTQAAARRVADLGSESEREETKCRAYEVHWATTTGSERLAVSPCDCVGSVATSLLVEDRLKGDPSAQLCPSHCAKYMQVRYHAKAAGVPVWAPLQGILQSLPQQDQWPYRHTTRD